ncbi:MAG: hypothetical protein JNL30_18000 [Rubrivivax sp.]|nr:hypothetical protein [Rubrivivax sp.]
MIRPRPARWFELLVARDDTTLALEALAATGAVELETRGGAALPASLAELQPLLLRFDGLVQRYQAWWPADRLWASSVPEPPLDALQRCLDQLQAWAAEAEPLIRRLQDAQSEHDEVQRWQRVIEHLDERRIDLGLAAAANAAGGPLRVRLAITPVTPVAPGRPGTPVTPVTSAGTAAALAAATQPAVDAATRPPAPGPETLRALAPGSGDAGPVVLAFEAAVGAQSWHHTLAVGTEAQLLPLAQLTAAAQGHWHGPPPWLQSGRAANLAHAAARLRSLQAEVGTLRARLAALADTHALRRALADARRLRWVLDNVRGLEAGEWLSWITGWTSAPAATLEAAIERSGARALLRLPPAPQPAIAPLLLANPAWARPFEVFARALGMPSGQEADPSVLLAVAVPLMFGYMFGDVGQGLVIAAAGFGLRRRFAIARLFIAGGLAATAFGFLFGSVFSLHVLPPLWIEPLADPLAVLVAPLAGGALLLTVGLALSGLEAHWRGEPGRWLATDAGYVLCYLALAAAALDARALWAAAAGALWFCVGHVLHPGAAPGAGGAGDAQGSRRGFAARLAAALTAGLVAGLVALGELVERLLQILINTLSFARVGAFALAHAGLSSAIVALAQAAPNSVTAVLVVVVGNAIVIGLEGLVVSIQTTRLVLFEFFARFLTAQGRVFRPLPLPPSSAAGATHATSPHWGSALGAGS